MGFKENSWLRWLVILTVLCFVGCSPEEVSTLKRSESDSVQSLEERIQESSIRDLQEAYRNKEVTVTDVTGFFLDRIERLNPVLHAVIAVNPNAKAVAAEQDALLESGESLGLLFGIPLLIKDNIETKELPTTAGSLALVGNATNRDAEVVARLRSAGAIILGKANLSEWANFRSERSSSGWSGVGGQSRNPHDVNRSPCGSSSGSAAGVAGLLAVGAVGTETNGSVVCPASVNGVVGIKPNVGLVSQSGIVPISHTQDTAGPIARSVLDAAILLNSMVTGDRQIDYTEKLDERTLRGKTIGVVRSWGGFHEGVDIVFEEAIQTMKKAGATIVDNLRIQPYEGFRKDRYSVLLYEFKHDLNEYLAELPNELNGMTLESLIAFNEENQAEEMPFFKQEIFLKSLQKGSLTETEYLEALDRIRQETRANGIDSLIDANSLDALIAPTTGAAWSIDLINGDHSVGGGTSSYPAISGYPHITLPMGRLHGLPLGLSIIGREFSELELLAIAYSFEQHANIDIRASIE